MRKRIGLILSMLSLFSVFSCATSKQIYTADGQRGYSITCSGQALNWGMCYEKAGEICGGKGYDILEKSGEQGATVSMSQYGLFGGSTMNRIMIIKCK